MSKVVPFEAAAGRSLTPSPSTPNGAGRSSLASRLEDRLRRLGPGLYEFPAGKGLDHDERGAMRDAMAELDRKLAALIPDDGGDVLERISRQLIASFKAKMQPEDIPLVYDGFLIALPGRSTAAAYEAVRRLARSEAPPKYSRTFAPTCADVAELAIDIEAEWRLERDRLARLLTIPEERPALAVRQPTEAEMVETRAKIERMAAASVRTAEPGRPDPVDLRGPSPAARVAMETARRRRINMEPEADEG